MTSNMLVAMKDAMKTPVETKNPQNKIAPAIAGKASSPMTDKMNFGVHMELFLLEEQ